ncbi:hypothetical protein ICJ83_01165 [Aestuariibaculum sp. TT11]|uniref:Glycine dehydrogenase n=2 Tax=Aestuariibaculum sediminum TaxID=2770637 RepID=A0A8J6U824_9FLAO|nr:hypothetical protein [Aestuariibaculum sediminum]
MPCREANHVCDKSQYQEATVWEKVKLNIHLLLCSFCRNYTKNNTKLTRTIKASNISYMDKTCKEALKKEFDKALKEHQIN